MTREVVIVDGTRALASPYHGTHVKELYGRRIGSTRSERPRPEDKARKSCRRFRIHGLGEQATSALNGSRWCVLGSGLPISTAASYVEMQCGSAIDSINHAAWRILANQADVVMAGI